MAPNVIAHQLFPALVSCFGASIKRYILTVEAVLRRTDGVAYAFMPLNDFEIIAKSNVGKANQIYWAEMLARAHLASCTSLRRNLDWMNAVSLCVSHDSFLGFVSALRALIESTGDSADILIHIPSNVARDHRLIMSCVDGTKDNQLIASAEMEEELIAYSHARHLKKGEAVPQSHKAKPTQYYIKFLEEVAGLSGVSDLYRMLCDVMHPAIGSVLYQLVGVIGKNGEAIYCTNRTTDKIHIEEIRSKYQKVLAGLVAWACEPGLITLRALHRFELFPKIPELRSFDFVFSKLADETATLMKL